MYAQNKRQKSSAAIATKVLSQLCWSVYVQVLRKTNVCMENMINKLMKWEM